MDSPFFPLTSCMKRDIMHLSPADSDATVTFRTATVSPRPPPSLSASSISVQAVVLTLRMDSLGMLEAGCEVESRGGDHTYDAMIWAAL